MTSLLVRFARRLTSWEPENSDEDVLKVEFWQKNRAQPDLRPSVYEVGPEQVERAYAEHATAFTPPVSGGGVDLGGTGRPVEHTLGDTGFPFTMEAHRELQLKDSEDLLALIHDVRASLQTRTYKVSRTQVIAYASARLAAGDADWERAQTLVSAQKWLKKIVV